MRNAGGVPIIQGFLTPEALVMVGAEVRAVAEAEDTIALAQAVEGAAVLSALATVEVAEEVQQAAVAETARVLIAAGLIEQAAAQDVIDTLVAADLIKQEALGEARAAVAQANAEVGRHQGRPDATNGQLSLPRTPSDRRTDDQRIVLRPRSRGHASRCSSARSCCSAATASSSSCCRYGLFFGFGLGAQTVRHVAVV